MPPSFFSKLVKQPGTTTSNNGSPKRLPSPSPSRRSLRANTIANGSPHAFPRTFDEDVPEMPKLVLTNHETDGSPVEGNLVSPGSLHRIDSNRDSSNGDVRHRRAITMDDKDMPTPTENTYRTSTPTARARTSSAPGTPGSRPSSLMHEIADVNSNSDEKKQRDVVESTAARDDDLIVESPQPIKPTSPTADPISPQLLPQSVDFERESDSVSIASSSGKKKQQQQQQQQQQPWRSNSTSRKPTMPSKKPTGIAGALAATGLAMANPAQMINVPQSIQQQLPQPQPTPKKRNSNPNSTSIHPSVSLPALPSTSNGRSRHREVSGVSIGSTRSKQTDINEEEESDGGYDSPDLDLNDDDMPVTGFAVASAKRNADFHELFRPIPEGDYLIDDYGCALQREILIQGRMYISENHVCFHANIFGWITDLTIPMYDIISIEKKMTAFVIPNAILITTRKAKYTFASFLARDTVYDVIHNIWRTARPDVSSIDATSARASLEEVAGSAILSVEGLPGSGINGASSMTTSLKQATQCACGKRGEHYPEKALECVVPGTPEKVYTLLFQSAFMKEFMREEQKLLDIQISDWSPAGGNNPRLLMRNMSYIKPLSGAIGPKQTKCELHDETVYLDYDEYVSTVTTTRTPDVPSGSVFSVKTRTCLMWAGNNSTRIIVTTTIEWTGRSFIKSVIEKSALEGQKNYHVELERHIKRYISSHLSEFLPEGASVPGVAEEAAATLVNSPTEIEKPSTSEDQRRAPDRRGLQWALDTFTGAYNVGKQSANGAIELLRDAWDTSSSTSLLYSLVIVLVLSNIYTFLMVGKREEVGRRKAESRRSVEREQWIGDTVRVLLQELRDTSLTVPVPNDSPSSPKHLASGCASQVDQHLEVARIREALDDLESRVTRLRKSLVDLD